MLMAWLGGLMLGIGVGIALSRNLFGGTPG